MKSLLLRCFGMAFAISFFVVASVDAGPILLKAKTDFGGGDGWLAPAEATYLQGANVQRGLTYNPANNHLYLVDRNGGNFIRILNGDTGALLGSLDTTGIAGGTFLINMIDVAEDGVIYAANLTVDTDSSALKIYRWATEASPPTVAFNGVPTNGADVRLGDDLAAIGSGMSTILVAGGNQPSGGTATHGDNSFAIFTTTDGLNFAGQVQDFVGTEPANGSFRLGIDFIDTDTVIGRQATGTNATVGDYAAGTATVVALAELINSSEAPLAVDRVNNLLATVQFNSNDVRLYDISDVDNPVLQDTKNLTTAFVANTNGTGDLKFGNGMLYVLNTNNGIQAFRVIPEPVAGILAIVGGLLAGCLHRRHR